MDKQEFRVLILMMLHAILADGNVHEKERALLENTARTLNIEITIPEDISEIQSLEALAQELTTPYMKAEVLTLCMDTVTADGELNDSERLFLQKLGKLLGMDDDQADKYVHLAGVIADKKREFNSLLLEVLGDYMEG